MSKSVKILSIHDTRSVLVAHYELENAIVESILKLEIAFRNFHDNFCSEVKTQRETIERMWLLSQRYNVMISTGPCCIYAEPYLAPAEDVVVHEFHDKLQAVRISNCKLMTYLKEIRPKFLHFNKLCQRLDMSMETPLIMGDAFHKPLKFFIEVMKDIFQYIHVQLLKMVSQAHLVDPAETGNIEDYKMVLEKSEDFEEYFDVGLTYCKCLQIKKDCKTSNC